MKLLWRFIIFELNVSPYIIINYIMKNGHQRQLQWVFHIIAY